MDSTMNEYMSQMAGESLSAMGNYAKIWTDFMTKMALAGVSATPGATAPDAARQMRGSMFRSMAEMAEESMRTPQFLEMMRQSMDAMLGFRKHLDSFFTQTRQASQGTTREDIDSIMLTIRHMERRILDRVEDLAQQMDAIEERLAAAGAINGHAETTRRARRR